MKTRLNKNIELHLFIFVLCLASPWVLYLNRHLDDNRLTSWQWVFATNQIISLIPALLVGLVLAWLLCHFTFYEQRKSVVLFTVSFAMGACFWSEPEVIVDSARYFTQAKQLHIYGINYFVKEWGKEIFAWTDLPLVPFLYGLIFKYLGEQRILIQILNTLFFSSTVVLTYQLGKTLWHEDLGFWGGLLLLGFPYLYTQVPLLLVDIPTMFFFLLGVMMCINALKEGGTGRIVLAGISLFLAFYVKYSTWMLFSLLPVIGVYYVYKNRFQAMRRGFLLASFTLIIIGASFYIYKDIFLPQLEFLIEYQKPGLQSWSESYGSTFLFQIHPFITAAAIFALIAATRKIDFRFAIISFLVLLFLVLQIKRIRYTMPVFPMLALMAAYGLAELKNKTVIKQIALSVVATSFVMGFSAYLPFLKTLGTQNLQAAGHYLDSLPGEHFDIITIAQEKPVLNPASAIPLLDIYTDKKLIKENDPVEPEIIEEYKTSPLRFTWEFSLPEYYSSTAAIKADGMVIVSDVPEPVLPQENKGTISGYPFVKYFHKTSGVFQHQTFVTVYHK